jgi:hypothetical protein
MNILVNLCPICLDNKLRGCLGRRVIVENRKQQVAGMLLGFQVDGRALKVVVQEKKHFHIIETVTKLSFQDQSCEEIEVLERT